MRLSTVLLLLASSSSTSFADIRRRGWFYGFVSSQVANALPAHAKNNNKASASPKADSNDKEEATMADDESSTESSWLDGYKPPDQDYNDYGNDHHHHKYDDDDDNDDDEYNDSLDSLQLHPLLQIPCSLSLTNDNEDEDESRHSNNMNNNKNNMRAVPAFLDTGAQRTVMSWEAAQQLGFLLPHLDRRYAGRATGVGSCAVMGRIPAGVCQLHLGNQIKVPSPAITVIESTGTPRVGFLLGLDFLRDHETIINLRKQELQLRVKGKERFVTFIRPRGVAASACSDAQPCSSMDHQADSDAEDEYFEDETEKLDMSGV